MPRKDVQVGVRMPAALRERIQEEVGPDGSEAAWIREALDMRLRGDRTVLPPEPEFREALDRLRAYLRSPDDEGALRFAVLAVGDLLQTDEGRSLLFGQVIGEATTGGKARKKGG